jgi:arabinofuranan 3-O-arabinosyltransferase
VTTSVQLPGEPRDARVRWRRSLTAVLWVLAVGACAHLVARSYLQERYLIDFRALHDGATRFWDGVSVYDDPWFLLTPSGLLAMLPFGLLGPGAAFVLWNTLSIAAIVTGVVCALRIVGASLTGPVAAVTTLLLCVSESVTETLRLGNLNNSLLLALGAGFLLAELRGRVVLAGVLLGLSLALKPVLVLLLLLPLLRRGWRTVAWAISLPVALNVLGLALVPVPSDFFDVTVPNLLHARELWNNSLWAFGTYLDAPGWSILAARVLVLALAVTAVWRLRAIEDEVLRITTSYGVLVLATFLASSLSQAYYSLFLVPVLLTVVRAGSALRTPVAWLAVYLFGTQDSWQLPLPPEWTVHVGVSRWPIGWLVLFAVLVVWALRPATPRREEPAADPHRRIAARTPEPRGAIGK